jgi:hypothetical protein
MWSRIVSGSFICLVGLVWIAQGTNVLHGSGMSGHGVWAVVGAVVVLLGVAVFVWAWRIRNRMTE